MNILINTINFILCDLNLHLKKFMLQYIDHFRVLQKHCYHIQMRLDLGDI